MDDPQWQYPHQYVDTANIYNNEIGKIAGVRFVETTEAKIWNDNTCPTISTGHYRSVYATMILGDDAYGVTDITGGGLQHIVKQLGSSGTADPLSLAA